MRTAPTPIPTRSADERGVNILARTLFRQMREQGYSAEQIIGLSSELIHLVSSDMRDDLEPAE
jgi:hypothetical protein